MEKEKNPSNAIIKQNPSNAEKEKYYEKYNIDLGPLNNLMLNDRISDILVNGPDKTFIEEAGQLYETDVKFENTEQLNKVIDNILSPLGKYINAIAPMCDARLPDGSRVNIIIPPVSLIGPMISIRKFTKRKLTMDDLLRFKSLDGNLAKFFKMCVLERKNIVISGGTGSGKTTLLNIITDFIPDESRIITIEDTAELQLHKKHIGKLEARPADIHGEGEITIRQLVINALRMRPDRIVIGECRGGEALDMLQAMNTGHYGSLTTIHANTPRDMLNRLETMVLMAGVELPVKAIREQVVGAIDIIIHVSRFAGGDRKVASVIEVTGMEGDIITISEIFCFNLTGTDNGRAIGRFEPTGVIPTFLSDKKLMGIDVDRKIFKKVE